MFVYENSCGIYGDIRIMLPKQEENNFTLENIVSSVVVQSYSSE